MGNSPRADVVEIRWPSGQVDRYADVSVNTFYVAREADGLKPDPRIKSDPDPKHQSNPGLSAPARTHAPSHPESTLSIGDRRH